MKNDIKEKAPSTRLKKAQLQEKVLEFLDQRKNQSFNYKQIAYGIDVTSKSQRNDLLNLLDDLVAAESIIEVGLGKYRALDTRATESEGIFSRRSNGKNAVIIGEAPDQQQIMVAERNSMHALNGDRVRVEIAAARPGQDPEAKVLEILEPKEQVFIGTLNVEKNYAAVVTDSKFLAADIVIPRKQLNGCKHGD
ncbi:MAG: ribonuclease R, partial [Muribaculaceae bacterium]|nr:ribonuclease R [Muribaculaceae bacterium]